MRSIVLLIHEKPVNQTWLMPTAHCSIKIHYNASTAGRVRKLIRKLREKSQTCIGSAVLVNNSTVNT